MGVKVSERKKLHHDVIDGGFLERLRHDRLLGRHQGRGPD
jgi:hypothetical protein